MELSKKDRVFLINQYQILKHIDIDPENIKYYEECIEILSNGYEIFYSTIYQSVCNDMLRTEGELVLEVLEFYSAVEHYKAANPSDTDVNKHMWGHFHGFDHNEESEYLNFTNFLINKQGKFEEQKKYEKRTNRFNSHQPVVDIYRRMVAKWHSTGRNFLLSKEGILEILNSAQVVT
jgi:uncharacterized protein YfbU (UPF0304 family)